MIDLHGYRVLLTRSAEDCNDWAADLARAGAEAVIFPCITAEIIDTPGLRAALAAAAASADWIVFTSRRGVEAFAVLHPTALAGATRIAAVGKATGEAARAHFGHIDHVGSGTAAALGESLPAHAAFAAGARCLLAVAANASSTLDRALVLAGARCTRCDVYRTNPAPARARKEPLSGLRVDKILFASPSAVEGFMNRVDIDTAASIVTIGPSTSAAARAFGLHVTAQAREPSLEELMEALHDQ